MPEITIEYEKPETLKILKTISKYFNFRVLAVRPGKKTLLTVNGVTIVLADKAVDTSGMEAVFSGRNIDASDLRAKAWQRH